MKSSHEVQHQHEIEGWTPGPRWRWRHLDGVPWGGDGEEVLLSTILHQTLPWAPGHGRPGVISLVRPFCSSRRQRVAEGSLPVLPTAALQPSCSSFPPLEQRGDSQRSTLPRSFPEGTERRPGWGGTAPSLNILVSPPWEAEDVLHRLDLVPPLLLSLGTRNRNRLSTPSQSS